MILSSKTKRLRTVSFLIVVIPHHGALGRRRLFENRVVSDSGNTRLFGTGVPVMFENRVVSDSGNTERKLKNGSKQV